MIYFDTETVGLHGIAVLIQWAENDGPIHLHEVWTEPAQSTLALIERIAANDVCGFNLSFDLFHLNKLYNLLRAQAYWFEAPNPGTVHYLDERGPVRELRCVKPKRCCDLMLHARRGPYQSLMDRKDIFVRRVPVVIAQRLADELNETIELDPIYFAGRKTDLPPWGISPCEDAPDTWADVVLRFRPSGGLKALASHAFGEQTTKYSDLDGPDHPDIPGWNPFGGWLLHLPEHIEHWRYDTRAREYATADVELTRRLHKHFDSPEPGDHDSELAGMVAACRYRGFAVDVSRMREMLADTAAAIGTVPVAPAASRKWLHEILLLDFHGMVKTTDKTTLETVATEWAGEPVGDRAQQILDARRAIKLREVLEKFIQCGRFHPDFHVIGTKSGRMSGAGGLNAQGIQHGPEVRACFPLADPDAELWGGDFDSFEVALAAAAYRDEQLISDLQTGYKVHGIFGGMLSGLSYDEVLATKGNVSRDWYDTGKKAFLSLIYGGDSGTIVRKLRIDPDVAREAYIQFLAKYPQLAEARQSVIDQFCSMRQEGGIGTEVQWHEPVEYIESMLGWRRYFTLENHIARSLFHMANNIPKEWYRVPGKVVRRDRPQRVAGAVCSALYGAAFSVQSAAMRAAGNHRIQSTGAGICKHVQRAVWDCQPSGIHPFLVAGFQVHDELMACVDPNYARTVADAVRDTVESYRELVPLIKFDWGKLQHWGEK